ncbi:hypothetical protein SERLA73DRAFT_68419 [Serpula lacrymans var. lacrymans S7.3]|uniref:DDE-1 domain-containing protein n=2 Tax=Serpula lacrymans var. lacrymans TaxID=341189 RepID=F8PFI2_SERL3|nr:uncharacterized protein SERLADRAFT_432170 [Serpula lacrymans var. lacrymans S7.9]EGO04751.1 hypothetical protein SERLA73DRAFT_68419 [Serpula lacrymans var. lacrymans S7.3]EGO30597.1 hypothetical protein SERLADRAFT_432170 [Serpula lacrymans var. lacrymans S7.9]
MAGRAKSKCKKQRTAFFDKEEGLAYAIKLWNDDKEKPEEDQRSLQAICREAEEEMNKRKKKHITIDRVTLMRQLGARGFPLDHKRLKFHVDTLLQARLGNSFPETGVGMNWTGHFLNQHSERLGTYWSSPLDSARGRAVNKHTHKAWCNLLESTIKDNNIVEDCIWAADETGFQPGNGRKQRVIGPAQRKMQHQQRDGNCKNITVMVTICADGGSIAPTIIYKGKSFLMNWHQDNTLKALVAHSPKGWPDGAIGRLWIEDFNNKTREKVHGRACLLLVDGHNSHYTKEFLDYAREHIIHVLCYPAHATHIYQGLDIVVFSPLKNYWTEARDSFESSTHQKITKNNFIIIYERAHLKALTPETIFSAFRATGVWPLDRNIITEEMIAPSLETSSQGQLPLPQPSPVCVITSLMCQY